MPAIRSVAREALAERFRAVRARSLEICAPLTVEDHVVQSMPDVSPPKWHLAHVTWFFETFVLEAFAPGFRPFHPQFRMLFNSYYETVGQMHARPRRGLLSRPSLAQVHAYRTHVDLRVEELLAALPEEEFGEVERRILLGLAHEEQHQELLLMDIKHILGTNPMRAAYKPSGPRGPRRAPEYRWVPNRRIGAEGAAVEIGASPELRVGVEAFDNEFPRHSVQLRPYALGNRCVTNGEYRAFVEDGGYRQVDLWLADGWAWVQQERIEAPLYWESIDGTWSEYTLDGLLPLDDDAPVAHVSYFEAAAYANWAARSVPGLEGARLPTEAEWEAVAAHVDPSNGHWLERGARHPHPACPLDDPDVPAQMFGDVWEWTSSPYVPYPGFRPLEGSLGEYNGKFMCNQFVLRGGSCLSAEGHVRATYRNFFYPHQRWAMQGFRLARDA